MLKIFAFSDLHGEHQLFPELTRRAKQADVIICAGDLTWFEHETDKLLATINSWNKPVLMIHGNHETKKYLEEACKAHDNILFSHGQAVDIEGVTFLSWGGGGFARVEPELAFLTREWKLTKEPRVLITHAPPRGTHLDSLDDTHVGCQTVTEAIEMLQPEIAVSGHIHECAEAESKMGKTLAVNVGPMGRIFEINN